MYISPEAIATLENRFGRPHRIAWVFEMKPDEFEMVRRSQRNGRAHDVTLFIVAENQVVVIKKPSYPPGAYRPPSGGVCPGEDFVCGALREAYEETGLSIELQRYLMQVNLKFTCNHNVIDWTTHVFLARPLGGELNPIDAHEIAEARFATVDELRGPIRDALLTSGSSGLKYRAELSDEVLSILTRDGQIKGS